MTNFVTSSHFHKEKIALVKFLVHVKKKQYPLDLRKNITRFKFSIKENHIYLAICNVVGKGFILLYRNFDFPNFIYQVQLSISNFSIVYPSS